MGGGLGPVIDNTDVAALASRLVGQLPREDRRAARIAGDNGLDVGLILRLCGRARVEGLVGRKVEEFDVGRDSTIVAPVVDEVDDQLNAILLGGLDDIVQTLKPIGTSVDLRALAWDE